MTIEEIIKGIEWKDATETGTSIGKISDLYKTEELLLVKKSKNDAPRATIMVKKDNKVSNIIISKELTVLVRAGLVTLEHLIGFPVLYNDKQNQLYVGRPSEGWKFTKDIKETDYVATPVSLEELAGF